jgi:hypothetical protein
MHESFNRHDVIKNAKKIIEPASSPYVCESCGKVLATFSTGHNFWFNGGIGVPGSPDLASIACDAGQHWACSIDCWSKVAHACIEQHLLETMKQAHVMLEEKRVQFEEAVQERLKEDVNSANKV